jgi:peroxiredoxin
MSLNLAFWAGDEMRRFMSEASVNLGEYQGNESWMVPVPATFVVGKDGVVRERFVDPDYRKRMTIETMLKAFRA